MPTILTRAFLLCAAFAGLLAPRGASAQDVDVREVLLDNGLRLLLVPREGDPNIAAGWIARVGSVNERPGITGIAHLFEHMMFKGTRTIGTSDIATDLAILEQLDETKRELAIEDAKLVEAERRGKIENASDPAARSEQHAELRRRFEELLKKQKDVIVKDEFDRIYNAAGASGMNAGTSHDFTIYFINVPATKLELWFWMESDRLLNPVFREFYSERDVVREERRLRVESTPTGRFEEQFDALFWGSSPYSWPVIGWPSDVEGITREEALAFYDVYYAPNNLTACLVGDFDPAEAEALAKKYFGRLKRGPREPEPVRTREVPQLAEKRMIATAPTRPEVTIRYHTVADGHVDEPALVLLADILDGRTGRLYKELVLEKKIATSASAGVDGRKYEGYFELSGVAAEGHTPEEVEAELERIIADIVREPVSERELQKVKNQRAASEFRKLRSNFSLLLELLIRDANRSWRSIRTDPAAIQEVRREDIQRVAGKYLQPETQSVLVFHTEKSESGPEAEEGAEVAGEDLDDEDRARLVQFRAFIATRSTEDLSKLRAQLAESAAQTPPERQKLLESMIRLLDGKLKQVDDKPEQGAGEPEEEGGR